MPGEGEKQGDDREGKRRREEKEGKKERKTKERKKERRKRGQGERTRTDKMRMMMVDVAKREVDDKRKRDGGGVNEG